MRNNPMCCGSHCHSSTGEFRVLPYGGDGNLIICRNEYEFDEDGHIA